MMAIIAGELDDTPEAILNILLINENLFNHEFDSN